MRVKYFNSSQINKNFYLWKTYNICKSYILRISCFSDECERLDENWKVNGRCTYTRKKSMKFMLQRSKMPIATISLICKHCQNLIRYEIDILVSMEFNDKKIRLRSSINDVNKNYQFLQLSESTINLHRTDYKRIHSY